MNRYSRGQNGWRAGPCYIGGGREGERERKRGTNNSNPSSPGPPPSTSATTTMSRHSNFYVPFLIAGMIFTVRASPTSSS